MNGIKDWPRAFESFVLTTQLRSYKVTADHIQIGTMNISRGPRKSTTIRMLLNENTFLIQSSQARPTCEEFAGTRRLMASSPSSPLQSPLHLQLPSRLIRPSNTGFSGIMSVVFAEGRKHTPGFHNGYTVRHMVTFSNIALRTSLPYLW